MIHASNRLGTWIIFNSQQIGKADLLAVAVLACLFLWPALVLTALGLEG